jgi:hypothetical protein
VESDVFQFFPEALLEAPNDLGAQEIQLLGPNTALNPHDQDSILDPHGLAVLGDFLADDRRPRAEHFLRVESPRQR